MRLHSSPLAPCREEPLEIGGVIQVSLPHGRRVEHAMPPGVTRRVSSVSGPPPLGVSHAASRNHAAAGWNRAAPAWIRASPPHRVASATAHRHQQGNFFLPS
ncbi:hypothetical protein QYE76_006213 [Lolium multiflorum]|uniref:Uncharacterized protein n=1 Tax=Lolium multiflorum TaxID=4521 RepID=A0AAD8RVF7_LOLMU|nr:hypothetical protein QYE76_006213 [Lolium multiflorum]